MKKTILIVAILLTIPAISGATQLGAGFDCKVWREGMPIPYVDVPGSTYCKVTAGEESRQRMYELEKAVILLESKLATCQSGSDNSLELRIKELESRVFSLENLFNQLRGLLIQVVQMLIVR